MPSVSLAACLFLILVWTFWITLLEQFTMIVFSYNLKYRSTSVDVKEWNQPEDVCSSNFFSWHKAESLYQMPAAFPVGSTLWHYVSWPTKINCRNTLPSIPNHYNCSSDTVKLCSCVCACVCQQTWNQLITWIVIFKIPFNHVERVVLMFNSTDLERTVQPLSSCIPYRIHTVSSRSATVWAYSSLRITSTCCMPNQSRWSQSTITVFDMQYPSGVWL
jgi:hypothetical protein